MTESSAVSLVRLMQASHVATLEELPRLIADHAAAADMHDTALFLVDLRETVLREVTGRGPGAGEGGQEFTVSGSLPGQAYQRVELVPEPAWVRVGGGARRRWWVAVTDGVERLGVLRADTDTDTEPVRQALKDLASMAALLVLSKRAFSDSYARLVCTEPMNVAAAMQWNLTPPPAYAGHDATVGAVMEPAYQVGGDAFDYAVAAAPSTWGSSMPWDTTPPPASPPTSPWQPAATPVGRGATLAETSQEVERALIEQFNARRYVTAILADLDMESGRLTWVNRGHHLPILIRDSRWTTDLSCPPAGPMGSDLGLPVVMATEQLEPGDRLLLYTDGVVEARDARGAEFGRDRFVEFIRRHHSGRHTLHETLRRLMNAVMEHHDGKLDDDATVLLSEWRGGHQQELTP
ncbi:serine/threonine-protein phosphatase [Streptomyces werraensis]|nr:serine/threonine-protein phosphatase [Streptomyces werraensis]